MKSRPALIALLMLLMNLPLAGQVVRIASLSELNYTPRLVLFDDASDRSLALYERMQELATKTDVVTFYAINLDELSEEDRQKAREWSVDTPSMLYILWDFLEDGITLNPDFNSELLDELVEDMESMSQGIELYRDNKTKKAMRIFKKVFGTDRLFAPEAAYFVGLCYEKQGDFDAASNYYSEAAHRGVADACYDLGYYYETGQTSAGVRLEMACMMYEKAARQGHERAIIRLSTLRGN